MSGVPTGRAGEGLSLRLSLSVPPPGLEVPQPTNTPKTPHPSSQR